MGCSQSSPEREVHSDTGLPPKARKISNKQHKLPPKIIRKEQTKLKISRKKEIIKIREEIEISKIYRKKKSIKPRVSFLTG